MGCCRLYRYQILICPSMRVAFQNCVLNIWSIRGRLDAMVPRSVTFNAHTKVLSLVKLSFNDGLIECAMQLNWALFWRWDIFILRTSNRSFSYFGQYLQEDGSKVPLNNDKGVDIVGNLLQSSRLSVNRKFYGDIANIGHALIAYCHDPDNLFLQSCGIMGDPATCMRDPLFYRWHAYLTRIVQLHKSQLPNYTKDEVTRNSLTLQKNFTIKMEITNIFVSNYAIIRSARFRRR